MYIWGTDTKGIRTSPSNSAGWGPPGTFDIINGLQSTGTL